MAERPGPKNAQTVLSSKIYDLHDGATVVPHIPDEYRAPDGSPPRLYQSPLAVRVSEFAMHRLALEEASAGLALLRDVVANEGDVAGEDDKRRYQALMRVLGAGVAICYFRCFTSPSVHKLNPAVVHQEATVLGAHQRWFEVRDKHFAHDVNDQRQAGVGLLSTAEPHAYHILENQLSLLPSLVDVETWTALVARTSMYVSNETAAMRKLLADEVAHLTVEQINTFPEFRVSVGGAATRAASRRNKDSTTRKRPHGRS